MAAPAQRKDHHAIAFFRVEIDGIQGATFRKCSGLKVETEVFEYQEGGDNHTVRKLVGSSKASNIQLTRGFISYPALFGWRDEFIHDDKAPKRRNGSVVALAADGKTEVGRWNFQKAWPVRWEMSELDSSTGAASCEVLELAVERIVKGK